MKAIADKKRRRVDLSEDNDAMSSVRGSILKSNKSPSKIYRGTRNLKNESMQSFIDSDDNRSPSKFGTRPHIMSDEIDF